MDFLEPLVGSLAANIIAFFAFIIIGAFGFWLRGSALFAQWTGRGATTARIVAWAAPMAFLTWLTSDWAWWWILPLGVGFWVGCLPGWWGSLDLGRNEGTWLTDFIWHTLRGVLWTLPAAVVIYFAGAGLAPAIVMAAVGLTCGLVYELGYRVIPARATELGEALFGAAIGGAMFYASR